MTFQIKNRFIISMLKKFTYLYKISDKVRHILKEPNLFCYIGKWRHDPCLPIYRKGPEIDLVNYYNSNKAYIVVSSVYVKTGEKQYNNYIMPIYTTYKHKLPNKLKTGSVIWRNDIRKKFKKFGLSWIKPHYELPIWLKFSIYNFELFYKTKYGDFRYEFPAQFTIVAFGYSISFWTKPNSAFPDGYWETALTMIYDNKNIEDCIFYYTNISSKQKRLCIEKEDFVDEELYNKLVKKCNL